MDRGAWWATVRRVAKSRTRLRDFTFTFTFKFISHMTFLGNENAILPFKIILIFFYFFKILAFYFSLEEHFSLILVNTIKYKKKKIEIILRNSNFNKLLTIFKELSYSAIHSHLFCQASVKEMM